MEIHRTEYNLWQSRRISTAYSVNNAEYIFTSTVPSSTRLNSEINMFKFVNNNPISIKDPLGLKPICIPWISETTDSYFEKYPSCKSHISVTAVGIDPANYSTCIWKRETLGLSKRLTRPQKLCFGVAKCGKIIPFVISAGDWKEESKETTNYEIIRTEGFSTASKDNPEEMGGTMCRNPWPPFNWEYVERQEI
jgi:hypothetical protein